MLAAYLNQSTLKETKGLKLLRQHTLLEDILRQPKVWLDAAYFVVDRFRMKKLLDGHFPITS